MDIQDIAYQLTETTHSGYAFGTQMLAGEVEVLQVIVGDRQELPVYLSMSDDQILCITYIFAEAEVEQTKRNDMLEAMVEMNIPMPLSSFSKIQDQYVVFGALSTNSSFDDIVHEIVTLSDNSIDAIEALSEFLK